jgi:predicted transcriptional regulator
VFPVAVLGDLEQHVMAVLWRARRPLSVREVHELLHYSRSVAYTTVMTVLDRLAKKGTVDRRLDGRAWLYSSSKSCVDLHVDEILALLAGCGEGHGRAILAAVEARLGEVAQLGQESCLTTGDPAWTPPVRGCAFAAACAAAALDCGACPSRAVAS